MLELIMFLFHRYTRNENGGNPPRYNPAPFEPPQP
jgi:hypothetical protein